jgi:eukaryotic-like serine/threonine-protein kinase
MGSVYSAFDNERKTDVAIKCITRTNAANIYRLKHEFRSLADLSHPNLVTLHELVSDGDDWFITMELIDGHGYYDYVFGSDHDGDMSRITISDALPSVPSCRANITRLRSVLAQLSGAIYALHEAGKLHRDIKPSNVMVTVGGRVVVLDFGLVRDKQPIDIERTIDNDLLGTPAYMSPEQASGYPLTPASDWYSLGSMLYETLTGHLPFEGSVINIMQEKVLRDPLRPSTLVKDVPPDLDDICIRLLSRIPEDRPPAEEILETFTGSSSSPPALSAQSCPPPRTSDRPFVGRREELTILDNAFQAVRGGQHVTVFVHGISGIGKTALIRHFLCELIEEKKAVVLKGRCYERESVPYKALDSIVDALTKYLTHLSPRDVSSLLPRDMHSLAALFPVLQKVSAISESKFRAASNADPRVLRNRAFNAIKELLQRLGDIQPLVLCIEDLHWGDEDSARSLLEILSPPDPPAVLLIGSYRSDHVDASPFLQEILNPNAFYTRESHTHFIALDRLAEFEAQQMAQKILKETSLFPSERARSIAEEAEYIPFFISELARYAVTHKDGDGNIPRVSLDEVINYRVASLPEESKKLLEIFAVANRPTEQVVALNAAGLSPGDRTPLVKLRNARLIRSRGVRSIDTAEAYHSRISLAVRNNLGSERLKECRAALAEALGPGGK